MHGVFLPSGRWINLAQVVALDFETNTMTIAASQAYAHLSAPGDLYQEPTRLMVAEVEISDVGGEGQDRDLDALWDYLLGVSANLGEHTTSKE